MHQTSSRLLRMTDDDRPFTKVSGTATRFPASFYSGDDAWQGGELVPCAHGTPCLSRLPTMPLEGSFRHDSVSRRGASDANPCALK